MNCPYCGTPKFRTSRFRLADLPHLVLLQLPVRCRLCRERFHVTISLAISTMRAQREREDQDAAVRHERMSAEKERENTV